MGTLLLELAGPLQSWGIDGRFTERGTGHEPSKSGIVGLLASALGRRRTESVDDLVRLHMGVRVDQPGVYERDFQTMHQRSWDKQAERWVRAGDSKLSNRSYLADAVFVVGVEMEDAALDTFATALLRPAFPLYLGRRSCPPASRVLIATRPGVRLAAALADEPWRAHEQYRRARARRRQTSLPRLEVVRDEEPDDDASLPRETVRDVPVSFSPEHREYGWRTVVREYVTARDATVAGGAETGPSVGRVALEDLPAHDPWSALEG
ncbi:type I-E CRISPR-associated protein Cas5/CasD [bacterium]|nr:type I-E CRISPR-associated protein Cas5/CasD [bacterium]